jgi:hypothetical protein
LNEKSPLLSKRAQTLIESNRGFWPAEMNNHDDVRKHIRFHQILVNFSGIANVSGSSVYAQKMYDHADVNVGYCFAGMLLKSSDCRLIVDGRLLNDVTEQHGGGAEPLVNILAAEAPATLAAVVAAMDAVKNTADAAMAVGKGTAAPSKVTT